MPSAVMRLTSNRLLAGAPEVELDELMPFLTRVRLSPREILIECGQPCEHMFFIEGGIASLTVEDADGQPGVEVGMIGREGVVGAFSLLDDSAPEYACAVMRIPGPALRIRAAELRSILERCPVLTERSMGFVQTLARQMMSVAAFNARRSVIERCARWLSMANERIDGSVLFVTHETLSTMLGVRRSGVTLAIGALHKSGVIRASRSRIEVVDGQALEAIMSADVRLEIDP